MAAAHAYRRGNPGVSKNCHYKENSVISTNLPLIIVPLLQPPEVASSSRSQNKVDYHYNPSLPALCAFQCFSVVPEAISVWMALFLTPLPFYGLPPRLRTVWKVHKTSKVTPLRTFTGIFFPIELVCLRS